jgi:hypothetical protein
MRRTLGMAGVVAVSFFAGAAADRYLSQVITLATDYYHHWHDQSVREWPTGFRVVQIRSSIDEQNQPAYFSASQEQKPLLVSLHTWGGDYSQRDPLAELAQSAGWNYIHPNSGGPDRTPRSCLSNAAISDIDEAITFAIANGRVDTANIFIAGVSGGGYATIGAFMKTKYKIKEFSAWASITDLNAWYGQSKYRKNGYAENILACTSSQKSILNEQEAILRSPISWDPPASTPGPLEIYAGINDGYSGSVPISHSIFLFNKLAQFYGHSESTVSEGELIRLLTRSLALGSSTRTIGGRAVLFEKTTPEVRLVIFDGTHEMLAGYLFDRFQSLAKQP